MVVMATTISQRELRNDSAKIIRRLQAGETFVLTNNGVPVGELRPLHSPKRTVSRDELLAASAELPPYGVTAAELRAEMDTFIDPYVYDPYTGETL